jgi:hypothetical protein
MIVSSKMLVSTTIRQIQYLFLINAQPDQVTGYPKIFEVSLVHALFVVHAYN